MARLGFVDTEGNIFHINQNPDNSVLRKKKKKEETVPAMVKVAQTVEPTVKVAQTNFKNAENDLNLAQSRYETALANELKKTGKDYRIKFDDFTKNKISYQTKEQDKENATPKIEKIPIQEANKNLQNELADVQDKFDKWKIANYENNLAKAQSKPVTLWDKTGGNVTRALQDLVSPLTQGEAYEMKDEKGNKTYLPSYNELRQQEVQSSYGDNLIGKAAKFGGDVVYGGTKIAGTTALDAVTGGIGGKALYWTDMAHDNYKNVKNQGYSNKQAIANTIVSTGSEFLTEKLLGGLSKQLTGGEASAVEDAVSKAVSKVVSNPQAAKLIGSMTSEGLEEFTQEYIGALNDKITLGKDTNLEDLVKDSLYSGLVGAGTAGAVEGGINSINVSRPSFNQNNQPIQSQETPIQAPITQNNINTQEQVETTPTRQKNGQITPQQVQTRVEPQTIETKPVQIQQNNINATQKLENRVSGDKLLDAQDFINEVKDVGANVDDNGYVTVYHQTTPENAKKILDSGRMSSKEQAVFFSTSQNASQSDGRGSTKLEFKIPAEELELDDIFSDNADVKINLNGKKDIDVSKYLVRNNNIPVETSKLTQQEQQELDTLKDFPFELDEQQERRMDELLLKQNKDLEKNMSPVRDLSDVRDFSEVGSSKINAYQYDNPEVKPYFQEVAKDMLYDLDNSTKGERYMTEDGQFKGIKRNVPNDIAELLDGENGVKYSYKEIEDGLNAIIKDNGAENKAVAKRLEFYIDQRLRNGYIDSIAGKIPANNEYIETLRNKNAGENPNIAAEMEKEPVIVAKNNNGQEIKLKQSKNNPGIYNQEAISRDIKDINNQYKNKVVKGKNGMEVSNFYSNITEKSKFIDTDIRNMFKNENDLQFYKTVSNEESLNKANKEIGNTIKSQEKAFDDFISKKEQFDSTDMAKGWILLERFNQAADYDRAYLVAKQMKEMGTKSGQAIQMLNLQSRLTPEGMYKWAVSELMEAENKFNSEKGRTKQEIEKYRDSFRLTAEETEFIKNQMEKIQDMPQGREKNVELAKINSMLQDKLPHQKGQSLKSWMRISMLFNPKTQVRNVMGNTIITPVNAVSDVFASGVDKLISKKTGKRTIGTPSLGGLAAYGKGALQGIKEATQDYRLGIDTKNINQDRFDVGQGKAFNENHSGPLKGLRNKVAKGLNATNDLLGYVMDVGDRAFYQGSVENSLYNQQKINNTKEITNEMREIAENEGLQRTWNDNNEYTKAVLDLRRSINKIGDQMHIHVGEYGLGDLLIPFAKTPANLTKAIVDYSPVGFVNAITEGKNLKNAIETGNYTPQMQHDFSQTIGKATAGTLLYALGTILAKANITTGNSDEDKDLKNFMRYNLGIQPYSIKIGDKSFTYDWVQPIAAPFAITADVQKGMQENMTPSQAVQHFLTTGFNILSEQSFLSGINEVLNDNDGILSGMEQQIINIPATAMPTLLKQITDMFDGTKRQTYSKEGQIENMKKVAKSKDPVGSKQLAPQVDVLGNEIEKYGGDNNAFNVFLNPANTEKGKKTPVAEEIYSLYEATQDKSIIPRKVDYSTKINGENKVLTTQEMEKWQKASGKLVTQEVKRAMNSDDYKEMNNDEKAKVINKIVNYSYQKAKSDTFDTPLANTYNGVEKARNKGIPIADYYISTVLKSSR